MYKGNNVAETRPVQVQIYKHVEEYRINVVHHRSYKIKRSESPAKSCEGLEVAGEHTLAGEPEGGYP
jgi:hypothetical protein